MDVLDAIYQRRSVRDYRPEPVDRTILDRLLDAAVHAPSATNSQPWAFAVIKDRDLLERFAEDIKTLYRLDPPIPELASTPPEMLHHLRDVVSVPGYQVFHHARTLVVIYATYPGGVEDCYLAAENLMLAACGAGLGTCPIGLARPVLNRPETKRELGIPAEFVAALPIVVGYPAGPTPATSRRPPQVLCWR